MARHAANGRKYGPCDCEIKSVKPEKLYYNQDVWPLAIMVQSLFQQEPVMYRFNLRENPTTLVVGVCQTAFGSDYDYNTKEFMESLWEICNWDEDCTYQLTDTMEEGHNYVIFDLKEAVKLKNEYED